MRKTVTPEPIARSWSGGKDSALALGELLCDPALRAVALVTTINARLRPRQHSRGSASATTRPGLIPLAG